MFFQETNIFVVHNLELFSINFPFFQEDLTVTSVSSISYFVFQSFLCIHGFPLFIESMHVYVNKGFCNSCGFLSCCAEAF